MKIIEQMGKPHDPAVVRLYRHVWPHAKTDDDRNGCFGKKAHWYLLVHKNQLVGFVTVGHLQTYTLIYNLLIHPEVRRRGYAKLLLQHVTSKHTNCQLLVRRDNGSAVALYRSLGWVATTAERDDHVQFLAT